MPATTLTLNNILNYNFGSRTYSPALPSDVYFGLSTTLVDATGLATVTEPATANGYARVSYSNDSTPLTWTASTAGSLSNTAAVTFTHSGAAWGVILSIFIADSGTRAAGNVLWYATLAPSILIQASESPTWAIGAIVVTLT